MYSDYVVWCPELGHEGPDDGATVKGALDAEHAASKWAEREDAHSADYWIVGGSGTTVMVRNRYGVVRTVEVRGESLPTYYARETEIGMTPNAKHEPAPQAIGLMQRLGSTRGRDMTMTIDAPTTWYEVSHWGEMKITAVPVLRETPYQIVRADCHPGNAGRNKGDTYFPTWEAAHKYLLRLTQRELDAARAALARAHGRHGNVKGMKPNAKHEA